MKILIKDHMQKNVITVFPSATLYDCTDLMTKYKIGSIVIIDEQEKPIGILTKTDFIKALSETTLAITAGDFCNNFKHKEKVITISEDQSLFELLVIFTKKQIKHIPVVDNNTAKLKGIISSTDILCKLSELVVIDPLTRLANRRHISSVQLKLMRKPNAEVGILMIDLDDFKKINDNYGHYFGDKLLCKVAETISNCTRSYDDIIRYGGEEFLVILYRSKKNDIMAVAERIRKRIESIQFDKHPTVKITVSIGAAFYDVGSNKDINKEINRADKALYIAKQKGKNRVEIFS